MYSINKNEIIQILNIARLAPSVHNTQPWTVTFKGNEITIKIDWEYALKDGDPTKRQLYFSLGIFTEAFIICAKYFEFSISEPIYNNDEAKLTIKSKGNKEKELYGSLAKAIKNRTTDRSAYIKLDISENHIEEIKNSGLSIKASVWAETNPKIIEFVAKNTSKAIGLAISNPNFRTELSNYLVQPWSKKQRGISVDSLYIPKPIAISEPFILKHGIALSLEPRLEFKRWISSSGIIFITTKSDLHEGWFNAGRKYLRVCLNLELLGYSQATSAALVEASTFHEDIEKLLNTNERLQAIIRFGKGKNKRHHSPRIDASSILKT